MSSQSLFNEIMIELLNADFLRLQFMGLLLFKELFNSFYSKLAVIIMDSWNIQKARHLNHALHQIK